MNDNRTPGVIAAPMAPLTEEQIVRATDEISTDAPGVFVRVARAIERAHGIGTPGVPAVDERQQFEAAMGEALKADQVEYALSRAHLPGQPYTFLATMWAWSAWQAARGVSVPRGETASHQTPMGNTDA